MAVAPTMMRAASAAAPSMVARGSNAEPVAAQDIVAPSGSLLGRGGLTGGPGSFGYGTMGTMDRHAEGWFVPPEPPRQGRMDSGLFTASSEIFGVLFAPHPQYPLTPGLPGGPKTKAAIQHSVETYEMTSAVIHNELAQLGEQLMVTA
jgi:hypothetical protein